MGDDDRKRKLLRRCLKRAGYGVSPETAREERRSSVNVGDIFYTTWGYDQTNVDIVQIVSVSPTGKTVMAKMMSKKTARSEMGADYVVPDKAGGESFRLMVRQSDGEITLTGSYLFVIGSKRLGYFSPYPKRPIYETAIGWGH